MANSNKWNKNTRMYEPIEEKYRPAKGIPPINWNEKQPITKSQRRMKRIKITILALALLLTTLLILSSCTPNVKEVPDRSVATPTTNKWHLTVTYQCTGLTENITLTADSKPYLSRRGCIITNHFRETPSICGVRSFTFN